MTSVYPKIDPKTGEEVPEEDANAAGGFNFNLTSQRFDWRGGTFKGSGRSSFLAHVVIQVTICILAILIPCILYQWNFVSKPYAMLADAPPTTKYLPLEIIRWVLFLSIAYCAFVFTNLVACLAVLLVFWSFKSRKREVPRSLQRSFDRILALRLYAARFAAGIALLLTGYTLFPLSAAEYQMQMIDLSGIKGDPKSTVKETAQAVTSIAYAQDLRAYRAEHSFEFFVNRGAAAIVTIFGAIFLEKIIMQHIAVTFYYRSFGKRLSDNDFGLKTTRRLKASVIQSRPELQGKDTATVLFEGLCPQGAETVKPAEFGTLIPHADAERYFQLIDLATTGEVSRAQLARSIDQLQAEQDTLRAGMHEQAQIIEKLNRIFMFFTWVFIAIICAALFQVSIRSVVAALASIGAILMFLSTGTIKTAVESILFVVFTHPFDVGDRVIIKNDIYVVKELGLWTTTLIGPGNRLTYIANSRLRGEMIVNARRSPFQSETIIFNILPTTPTGLINKLEGRILEFYKEHPRDFIPQVVLGGYIIQNKVTMRMTLQLLHRGNFQDMELKELRSKKFLLFLKDAIAECGISLSPPLPP